jgi:hypothetical protein
MKLENFYKKISIAEYDSLPALRSTALKEFLKSPAHYKHSLSDEARAANDGKKHFLVGRLIHAALLEPGSEKDEFVVCKASTRTTNVYKETAAANPGKSVLLQHEVDEASRCVEAARRNRRLMELIGSSTPEVSCAAHLSTGVGNDTLYCKARLDLHRKSDGHVIDLKTTSMAACDWISSFFNYGYHVSICFYIDILLELGQDVGGATFIVLEKEPPYGIMFYTIDERMLEYGRRVYQPALARFKHCLETGDYPAYDQEPVLITPPKY